MEVKFMKKQLSCLCPVITQVQSQEQTQELKLPDGFPDIGKILGCWGQTVIRGKEWRRTSMNVNGGVMAWVLYAPEEDAIPRVMDAWIPFQTRWEFPESVEDGQIIVKPLLSNLDARNVSARKIILRAGIDLMGLAMEATKMEIAVPGDIPPDVELLTRNYPVDVPVEVGEKQIQLEENLTLPETGENIHRMIGYTLSPSVEETKILANRLVMRGKAVFKLRYLTSDEQLRTMSKEFPFSDYAELDRDYDEHAYAWILPVLTALEVDLAEDMHLMVRASIATQYTVFDRTILEVAEDAYSPRREISVVSESAKLPVLLDNRIVEISADGSDRNLRQPIDMEAFVKHPSLCMDDDGLKICLTGDVQIVQRDEEGALAQQRVRLEGDAGYPSAEQNLIQLWLDDEKEFECTGNDNERYIRNVYCVRTLAYSGEAIKMVSGLNMGEYTEASPDRPSMILRRANDDSLWSLAKKCGSTVDAIRAANHLDEEPEEGRMLLIPVI